MSETKMQNRWLVVISAVVLELALGAIYAWGVYGTALTTAGWSPVQRQLPYMIGLASFAIVVVFAGRLKERLGPKMLIIISASLLLLGYLLAGLIPLSPLSLTFTYGLLGGAGIGFSAMLYQ